LRYVKALLCGKITLALLSLFLKLDLELRKQIIAVVLRDLQTKYRLNLPM
jgi:hypothetical protein